MFHCTGVGCLSAIAAAAYLGMLPTELPPSLHTLRALSFASRLSPGHLVRVGSDTRGNEVHCLCRGREGRIIQRLLCHAPEVLGARAHCLAVSVEPPPMHPANLLTHLTVPAGSWDAPSAVADACLAWHVRTAFPWVRQSVARARVSLAAN